MTSVSCSNSPKRTIRATATRNSNERSTAIGPKIEAVELQATMAEPSDVCGAYIAIQAGEGGTDSADWAETLLRMYQRWAETKGYEAELLEKSPAEEAGIRNATLAVRADYAFGMLKGETGNHRLIRISPFDSAGRRHTSFAAVDVTPAIDDETVIDVDFANDVREDTFRAGGAGGQHVNKTSSAIRLTHLPTNVVVQCQNERSQHKNRAMARKMLIAKLYQLDREKKAAETAARRGQKSKIGFGGETIRNYVLHPEQFVKDTRTGYKSGNPRPSSTAISIRSSKNTSAGASRRTNSKTVEAGPTYDRAASMS